MARAGADTTAISQSADLPQLRQMQRNDPRRAQIGQAVARSGARNSTLLIAATYVGALTIGGTAFIAANSTIPTTQVLLCGLTVLLTLSSTGRFRTRMVPDLIGQVTKVSSSVLAGTAIAIVGSSLIGTATVDLRSITWLYATLLISALVADWGAIRIIRKLWSKGKLRSRALLLGSGRLASELAIELNHRKEYGVDLVAAIDTPTTADLADELIETLGANTCDRLIVCSFEQGAVDPAALLHTVRSALGLGVPTFVVPRLYEMGIGLDSMSPDRARGYPLVRVQRAAHPAIALRTKRLVDITISSLVLLAAAPAMAVIALAVKLTSPGPILFRQPRVGQHGTEFEMLKFRSMSVGNNEHGERSSDHRVTAVGRLLRATSLDELPQLLNVARGNMSLVGARPERLPFVEEGLGQYPAYKDRHRMPMGLTGLAQVAGLRGEESSIEERVKFDNLYIDQWSTALDLQIIAKTAAAILLQTKYRRRERELEQAISRVPAGTSLAALIGHEDA